jgi:hypothetical protein
MKKVFWFMFFSFIFMALITGCATIDEENADNIDFYGFDPEIPVEQYCYIKTPTSPLSILSIDGEKIHGGFITPGYHIINVRYVAYSSADFTLQQNFEAEKSYTIGYTTSDENKYDNKYTVTVFVQEITDSAENEFEKLKAFLVFSKINPTYLEGTWAISNGMPAIDTKISFAENRFTMLTYNRMLKFTINTEGRYYFNENIIILNYEKYDGKENNMRESIYYKLTGNTLNFISIKSGQAVVRYVKGQYNKIN